MFYEGLLLKQKKVFTAVQVIQATSLEKNFYRWNAEVKWFSFQVVSRFYCFGTFFWSHQGNCITCELQFLVCILQYLSIHIIIYILSISKEACFHYYNFIIFIILVHMHTHTHTYVYQHIYWKYIGVYCSFYPATQEYRWLSDFSRWHQWLWTVIWYYTY